MSGTRLPATETSNPMPPADSDVGGRLYLGEMMEAVHQAAHDIGLVLQNEYNTQKQIESFAEHAEGIVQLSNHISDMYHSRIHACLDIIDEAVKEYALSCSFNYSNLLADGAMLIRQMCLYQGSAPFDEIAQDYLEMLPKAECLGCEKLISADLAYCIECQIAMADSDTSLDMA